MRKEELITLIEQIVRKEVKTILKKNLKGMMKENIFLYTPKIVREIVDEEIEESLNALRSKMGKQSLTEIATLNFDSSDTSYLASRKNMRMPNTVNGKKMTNLISEVPAGVDAMMTRPVSPDEIPDYLKKAMNTDYRKMLGAIDEHKGAGMSSFVVPTDADFNKTID